MRPRMSFAIAMTCWLGILATVPVAAAPVRIEATCEVESEVALVHYDLAYSPHYEYVVRAYVQVRGLGRQELKSVSGDVGRVRSGGTIRWDYRRDGIGDVAGLVERIEVTYEEIRRANPIQISGGLAAGGSWLHAADLGSEWATAMEPTHHGGPTGFAGGLILAADTRLMGRGDVNLGLGVFADLIWSDTRWPTYESPEWANSPTLVETRELPAGGRVRLNVALPDRGQTLFFAYGMGWRHTWYDWRQAPHPDVNHSEGTIQRAEIGLDQDSKWAGTISFTFDDAMNVSLLAGLAWVLPNGLK